MNQILEPNHLHLETDLMPKQYKHKYKYKFQFVLSSFVACLFLSIFFIRVSTLKKNEKFSGELTNMYSLSTLYSNTSNYSATKTENNTNTYTEPFVIGMMKIDKINLNYPILSKSNKELLDFKAACFL